MAVQSQVKNEVQKKKRGEKGKKGKWFGGSRSGLFSPTHLTRSREFDEQSRYPGTLGTL